MDRTERIDLRLIGGACFAFSAAMALAASAPNVAVAVVPGAITGAAGMAVFTGALALVQTHSEPGMRGRTMALSAMVMVGGTALGGPVLGWISQVGSPRWALLVGATWHPSGQPARPRQSADAAVARHRPSPDRAAR